MSTERGPLPASHQTILIKLRDKLIKHLVPDHIRNGLVSKCLIDLDDSNELKDIRNRRHGVEFILDIVLNSGYSGLSKFVEVLREESYNEMVKIIEKEISNKFPQEINIVLFGKTGVGKSRLGNSLLKRKAFESKQSTDSVTAECFLQSSVITLCHKDVKLNIIDTPGLADTKQSTNDIMQEMAKCMSLTQGMIHIFIVVFNVTERMTSDSRMTIPTFQDRYGRDAERFVLVVFTHTDSLENTTLEDFIEQNEYLRTTVQMFHGNFWGIGKDPTDEEINKIYKHLQRLIEINGNCHYTNELYKVAEIEYNQRLEEEKRKLEEKEKEKMEKMMEKLRQEFNVHDEVRKLLDKERQTFETQLKQKEEEIKRLKQSPSEYIQTVISLDEIPRLYTEIQNCLTTSGDSNYKIYHIGKMISEVSFSDIPSSSETSPEIIKIRQFINSLNKIIEDVKQYHLDPQTAIGFVYKKVEDLNNVIRKGNETSTLVVSDEDNLDLTSNSSIPQELYDAGSVSQMPSWCQCGNCREIEFGRVCCKDRHPDEPCPVTKGMIDQICSEVKAQVKAHSEEFLRLKVCEEYTMYKYGTLANGTEGLIPNCVVWRIRDTFPEPNGQLFYFEQDGSIISDQRFEHTKL